MLPILPPLKSPRSALAPLYWPMSGGLRRSRSSASLGDSDALETASVATSVSGRKRARVGVYVMKQTANELERIEEEDKYNLMVEMCKPENRLMARPTRVLLQNGDIARMYEKKFGRKTKSKDDKQTLTYTTRCLNN